MQAKKSELYSLCNTRPGTLRFFYSVSYRMFENPWKYGEQEIQDVKLVN
jgi:hypothetical protein